MATIMGPPLLPIVSLDPFVIQNQEFDVDNIKMMRVAYITFSMKN